MIEILMLNYEYPPLGGGAGNATAYLLRQLSEITDIRITLITSSTAGYRVEKPNKNVTIHFLDIYKHESFHFQSNKDLLVYMWKAWRFCRHWVQENHVDLVHTFFSIPGGLIAYLLGLPYIVSLRGSDVPFYNPRFYWLDKLVFKYLHGMIWHKAKRVIANSGGLKALALKSFPEQKIAIITNGVDTNEFFPKKRKPPNSTLKLISVGRLIKRKGYNYLFEALRCLEGVELTLVGDGDQRTYLQELAQKFNLKVNFLGRVEHNQLPSILQAADVFVLPSLNEGMPNAALEAMACGLPLILTDTGGSHELIDGNGTIIPKRDPIAIQKAIMVYLQDSTLLQAQGYQSRIIAERMSWYNVAQAYLTLYTDVQKFTNQQE